MSAALALQEAMVARLKADAGVRALVGARVYDRVPEKAAFPYLVLDGVTETPTPADGLAEACTVAGVWRAWVQDAGTSSATAPRPVATRIARAVATALGGAALDLGADWALVDLTCGRRDAAFAADGVTVSADCPFTALIDPAVAG